MNKYITAYKLIAAVLIFAAIYFLGVCIWGIDRYFYDISVSQLDLRAYSKVESIELAMKFYFLEYGENPIPLDKRYNAKNPEEYDKFIKNLTSPHHFIKGYDEKGEFSAFLDSTEKDGGVLDPWGNRYDIIIKKTDADPLFGKSFIYSYGENKIDDNGDKDDISSWKEFTPSRSLRIKFFGNILFEIPLN